MFNSNYFKKYFELPCYLFLMAGIKGINQIQKLKTQKP